MNPAKQFLFDRSFDPVCLGIPGSGGAEATGLRRQAKQKRPLTVTEDDLARVRAEGIDEGRAQAIAEASDTTENRTAKALEAIAERLSELLQEREEAYAAAECDAIGVAVAIARKMVPGLLKRDALEEIENTVSSVISQVHGVPEMGVRVSENLGDILDERLATLRQLKGLSARLTFAADPALAEGDCRVEWTGGGAERIAAVTWSEVDAIIERNLGFVPAIAGNSGDQDDPNDTKTDVTLIQSDDQPSAQTELGESHD